MEPSFPSGDNLFGTGGPPERLRLCAVVLLNEAVDGDLVLVNGVEGRLLQSARGKFREERHHRLSDRCSTNLFDTNALRFTLATFAYVLVEWIHLSLVGTKLAKARPETRRLRLFRIGRCSESLGGPLHLLLDTTLNLYPLIVSLTGCSQQSWCA